ncbi:MAG: hypothetical protein Q8Q60_04965 [Candidatus Chromulinivorax sp.]|nr:hypothetical protein [Candidatus Chromulinivorax sp.]
MFMKFMNRYIVYLCFLIINTNNLIGSVSPTIAISGTTSPVTPPAAAITVGTQNPLVAKDAPTETPTVPPTPAVTLPIPTAVPAATPVPAPAATDATTLKQIGDNIAANWTAAIAAFGGSAGISAKTASKIMPANMTSTSLGFADAEVIIQFINGTPMNSVDSSNLTNALAINTTPPTTPETTPAPATPPTDAPATTVPETASAPATPATPAPATPAPATPSPTTTPAATPAIPQPDIKKQQIIISVYLQNNYEQDAILKTIELLLTNQTAPVVKNNLNIPIKAAKNIYSKGSITAFDITTESNSLQSFSGIQSITINDDPIAFKDIKTGISLSHPIAITKKDGHWVSDQLL